MKVTTKQTEDEIRRNMFGNVSTAAASRPFSDVAPLWCPVSESRLLSKIIENKPVGIFKHYNLMMLADYLSNVYEDEDVDFEELLTKEDLRILRKSRKNTERDTIMIFKPKYKIRPTPDQIMEKLSEYWDMSIVSENEMPHELLTTQCDFFLPEGEYSELLKKKEESVSGGAPQRKRAKRGGSPDSIASRCSTPANRN